MEHAPTLNAFDRDLSALPQRIITGLSKIGLALKSQSWEQAGRKGLTPTQGQILVLLRAAPNGMRLAAIAEGLGVSQGTASEATSSLVEKELVKRRRADDDARALSLVLTKAGSKEAESASSWPDFLVEGIKALTQEEQGVFLRGLVKIIRNLQETGRIPVQRMCVSCRYFQPGAHADPKRPHHCAFVDAAFGDRSLRLDCAEQEPADAEVQALNWKKFLQSST